MRFFREVFAIHLEVIFWLALLLGCSCPVPVSGETLVPQASVQLSAPRGVWVDGNGYIFVASPGNDRIVVLRNRPKLRFEGDIAVSSLEPCDVIVGTQGGQLSGPFDVALDAAGRVVVADTGNNLVKAYEGLYDRRGFSAKVIRGRGDQRFSSPQGVAVDDRDHVIVFDTGNARIQIFSSDGTSLAILSGGRDEEPPDLRAPQQKPRAFLSAPIAGCCLGDGYLVVADKGLPVYSVWKYDAASPRSDTCRFVGYGPLDKDAINFYIRDIAYDRQRQCIAYIGTNAPLRDASCLYIRQVNPDDPSSLLGSQQVSSLRIPLVGWLEDPAGAAFDLNGNLFITDAASSSVQKINRETFASLTAFATVNAQRGRAKIEYVSTAEMPTVLQYGSVLSHVGRTGPLPGNYSDPAVGFVHTAELDGLIPSTRYAYRYLLSRDIFCGGPGKGLPNFSPPRLFATQSTHRTIEYLDFPLMVVVLMKAGSASGTGQSLTDEQLEALRLQLEELRLFLWVNSRMTCNVKPDLVPVGELAKPLAVPGVKRGGVDAGMGDFLSALKQLVQKNAGRDIASLGSLFIIGPSGAFETQSRNLLPTTCGLDYLGGAVSIFCYAEDNTWSFIKEFSKQLSIMHLASGRDVSLSRLSQDPNADRSMVLWDSLADLARAVGTPGWLCNQYGIFRTTADDDEDGVPDDESECSLDEKRFGTSPITKDSDGDSVGDFNEILASRWASGFLVEGARVVESHVELQPPRMDSDDDGIADSEDRNPLCRLNDSIPKLNIAIDGKISRGEWDKAPALRIADPEYNGVLRVAWTGTHLCFSLTGTGSGVSQGPPSVRIRLDGAADGFLRGSDNLTILFEPGDGASFKVRQEEDGLRPSSGARTKPGAWPDLARVVSAWSIVQDSLQLEIGIPKSPSIGLNLFDGEGTRFDLELRPAKSPCWLRVFEPLTLFRGLLAQPQKES